MSKLNNKIEARLYQAICDSIWGTKIYEDED